MTDQPIKKRRTQFDRDFETTARIRENIWSLYDTARRQGLLWEDLRAALHHNVHDSPRYKKLPNHWQKELSGYIRALDDITQRLWTTFRYQLPDGTTVDASGRENGIEIMSPRDLFYTSVASGSYWIMPDGTFKPYFVSERVYVAQPQPQPTMEEQTSCQ